VDVKPQEYGTIHLSQAGLISRNFNFLELSEATSCKSTAAREILASHKLSPPFSKDYNYRSVLGKIMYLSSNTRCDPAFANHQCARFASDPRTPHVIALKQIGQYLLLTSDKGMIINPSKDLKLDCYTDSDFAGRFTSSDPNDP
jgi:hypothetical protein